MKSFIAGPNENEVRLSRFVESVTHQLPRSLMYKAFRNKRIKVNGKRAAPDTRPATGSSCISTTNSFYPTPRNQSPKLRGGSRPLL